MHTKLLKQWAACCPDLSPHWGWIALVEVTKSHNNLGHRAPEEQPELQPASSLLSKAAPDLEQTHYQQKSVCEK